MFYLLEKVEQISESHTFLYHTSPLSQLAGIAIKVARREQQVQLAAGQTVTRMKLPLSTGVNMPNKKYMALRQMCVRNII